MASCHWSLGITIVRMKTYRRLFVSVSYVIFANELSRYNISQDKYGDFPFAGTDDIGEFDRFLFVNDIWNVFLILCKLPNARVS